MVITPYIHFFLLLQSLRQVISIPPLYGSVNTSQEWIYSYMTRTPLPQLTRLTVIPWSHQIPHLCKNSPTVSRLSLCHRLVSLLGHTLRLVLWFWIAWFQSRHFLPLWGTEVVTQSPFILNLHICFLVYHLICSCTPLFFSVVWKLALETHLISLCFFGREFTGCTACLLLHWYGRHRVGLFSH